MQEGNGDNAFILIFSDNHGCPNISFRTAVWLYVLIAFEPKTDICHTKHILSMAQPINIRRRGCVLLYLCFFFQVHPHLSKTQNSFTSFIFPMITQCIP